MKSLAAESEGFEPSIPLLIYTLSRRAPSTTRTTLLFRGANVIKVFGLNSGFENQAN